MILYLFVKDINIRQISYTFTGLKQGQFQSTVKTAYRIDPGQFLLYQFEIENHTRTDQGRRETQVHMPLPQNAVIDLLAYGIEVGKACILILGSPVRLVADDVSCERSCIDLVEIVGTYDVIRIQDQSQIVARKMAHG